jgi:hypothetical protein
VQEGDGWNRAAREALILLGAKRGRRWSNITSRIYNLCSVSYSTQKTKRTGNFK